MLPKNVVDESPDREAPAMPQDVTAEAVSEDAARVEAEAIEVVEEQLAETEAPVMSEAEFKAVMESEKPLPESPTVAEIEDAKETIFKAENPAVEEARVLAPQNEPDTAPEPPKDLAGIITQLTPELYKTLLQQWVNRGKPREFVHQGKTWKVFTEGTGGYKFVSKAGQPGLDSHYGSLTIGKI